MRLQICIGSFIRLSVVGEQSDCHALQPRFKEGRMHDIHFRICLIKETIATEWVGEFRFENDGNEIFVTKSVFCIVNNDLTEMIDECKSVFKLLKFLSPFHRFKIS